MKISHLIMSLFMGLAVMTTACSNDNEPAENPKKAGFEFSVGILTDESTASRVSNTVKYEWGLWNEDKVSRVTVVIADQSLNSTGGNVKKVLDFSTIPSTTTNGTYDNREIKKYHFETESMTDLPEGTYYAMAFVNLPDAVVSSFSGKALDYIRNYVYTGDLYTAGSSISGNTNFVMTAINEVQFTYTAGSGEQTVTVTEPMVVQRLAARLDVSFGNRRSTALSSPSVSTDWKPTSGTPYDFLMIDGSHDIVFPIYDETWYQQHTDDRYKLIEGAEFHLTKIYLKNVRKSSSGMYLIERSAEDRTSSTPTYFGKEGGWVNGHPKNYIFSPTIASGDLETKTIADGNSALFNALYNGLNNTSNPEYSVLGYFFENTDPSVDDDVNKTMVVIEGTANVNVGYFSAPSRAENSTVSVKAEFPIRHSFGAELYDYMVHGVVRNTVYRVYMKFFANTEGVYAHYYYWHSVEEIKDGVHNYEYTDIPYTNIKFTDHITEGSSSGPSND